MDKFTPGPWHAVCVNDDGKYKEWQIQPDVGAVFYVNEQGAANARLIAAAPELVEALRLILKESEFRDSLATVKARALLNKLDES